MRNARRHQPARRHLGTVAIVAAFIAITGCSEGTENEVEPDVLEPDGDVVFEDEVDPETVITDPAGVANDLDGENDDPADFGDPGEDGEVDEP